MDSTTRKKLENLTGADIEAVLDDIANLKRDVAQALSDMKDTAVDRSVGAAQDLAEHLTEEAEDIYRDLAKRGQRTAKVLSRHVDEQPVTSLLVAFSVGFIVSRLLR